MIGAAVLFSLFFFLFWFLFACFDSCFSFYFTAHWRPFRPPNIPEIGFPPFRKTGIFVLFFSRDRKFPHRPTPTVQMIYSGTYTHSMTGNEWKSRNSCHGHGRHGRIVPYNLPPLLPSLPPSLLNLYPTFAFYINIQGVMYIELTNALKYRSTARLNTNTCFSGNSLAIIPKRTFSPNGFSRQWARKQGKKRKVIKSILRFKKRKKWD